MISKAKIADIFYGLQGEGIYAGKPQVFVRFYDCQLNCRFCDTRLTAYDKYTPWQLYQQIQKFSAAYHSLCLTGGEPLLQKEFLKQFLKLVKYDGITTYLETNGVLPQALSEVIDAIDIIAMDFKLPSSTGMPGFWTEHNRFLKIALKKEVFIKMVICTTTGREDIDKVLELILRLRAKKIPIVLQPNFFELSRELLARTRSWQKYCARHLARVEVIPQLHKMMGAK